MTFGNHALLQMNWGCGKSKAHFEYLKFVATDRWNSVLSWIVVGVNAYLRFLGYCVLTNKKGKALDHWYSGRQQRSADLVIMCDGGAVIYPVECW